MNQWDESVVGRVTEATISGLMISTSYYILVAAVNSAGTGKYSLPIIVKTDGNAYSYLKSKELYTYAVYIYIHTGHFTFVRYLHCKKYGGCFKPPIVISVSISFVFIETDTMTRGLKQPAFFAVLSVAVDSLSSTHLNISWVLDYRLTTTSYTISYSNTRNTQCFTDSDYITGIAASETMYSLTGLQEGTEYSITVTALLSDRGTVEDSLTATTMTAG